jgi:hypothetical protein
MFETSKENFPLSVDETTKEDEMLFSHKATSVADCTLTNSCQRTLSFSLIWKLFTLKFYASGQRKARKYLNCIYV